MDMLNMDRNELKYRQDIQMLRGLAVISVLLFHAKQSYFPLGYLCVDSFFVISGFVVTPLITRIFSQANTCKGLSNFFKSRFFRLAPAMSAMVIFSTFLIFLFGPPTDHSKFAKQGIATMLLNGNLGAHLYAGNYFLPNQNPLTHTWSLSVEAQIYIFLPLFFVFFLALRVSIRKYWSSIYLFISCLGGVLFLFPTLISPLYDAINMQVFNEMPYYSTVNRIWQFTIGGYFFFLSQNNRNKQRKNNSFLNYAIFLSLVLILFSPLSIDSKSITLLPTLLTCFALRFSTLEVLPGIVSRPLIWAGDRSYSIYLVHLPILYLAKVSDVFTFGIERSRAIQSVVAIVLVILLGDLLYSRIEMKFRSAGKQKIARREVLKSVMVLIIIPVLLLSTIRLGSDVNYWGLSQNIPQPKGGAAATTACFTASQNDPCIYRSGGSQTVLLVGDSHAASIVDALVIAGKEDNWSIAAWVGPGCGFRAEPDMNLGIDYGCVDRFQRILKWIKMNDPKALVISQYIKDSESQSGYKEAISEIRKLVPNVLLIANNPIFPGGKYEVFNRSLVAQLLSPIKKTVPLSKMEVRDLSASNKLVSWADAQDVTTLNVTPLFCRNETCSMYSKLGWLYTDNDHLSYAGSKLLIPSLSNYLSKIS
jgi:peptidoglycan/LPS O-acetylase OafA/YrhL